MEENNSNPQEEINKTDELEQSENKTWHAPKLVIEDTENTRGGTSNANAVGDDAWYVS